MLRLETTDIEDKELESSIQIRNKLRIKTNNRVLLRDKSRIKIKDIRNSKETIITIKTTRWEIIQRLVIKIRIIISTEIKVIGTIKNKIDVVTITKTRCNWRIELLKGNNLMFNVKKCWSVNWNVYQYFKLFNFIQFDSLFYLFDLSFCFISIFLVGFSISYSILRLLSKI